MDGGDGVREGERPCMRAIIGTMYSVHLGAFDTEFAQVSSAADREGERQQETERDRERGKEDGREGRRDGRTEKGTDGRTEEGTDGRREGGSAGLAWC